MSKIVTSARGERIDFDLIGIKSAMAALPQTDNVKKRERFINKKRRRGVKRRVDELAESTRLEQSNFAAVASTLPPPSETSEDGAVKRRKIKAQNDAE